MLLRPTILEKCARGPYTSKLLNTSFIRTGSPSSNSILYSVCMAFKYYRMEMESHVERCEKLWKEIKSTLSKTAWTRWSTPFEKVVYILDESLKHFRIQIERDERWEQLYTQETDGMELLEIFWDKHRVYFFELFENWKQKKEEDKEKDEEEMLHRWDEMVYQFIHFCIESLETEMEKKGDPFLKMNLHEKKTVIFRLIGIWKQIREWVLEDLYDQFIQETELDEFSMQFLLPILCDYFKINILIIDADTGKPSVETMKYCLDRPNFLENKHPYLLLLYFPTCHHFESLGKQIKYPHRPLVLSRFLYKKDPFVITYLAYLESQLPDAFRKD